MTMFRTYFYDLDTRKEIVDCPYNGKQWIGTGGNVRDEKGEYIKDTTDRVTVADYAGSHVIKGEKAVTAADFPGKRVAVKIWYSPNEIEWRKLVAR